MKKIIYEWVKENSGESEADNPSWDIEVLAKHIESKLQEKTNKWIDVLNYWYEHVEDYGIRYPDMHNMVKQFEKTMDDIYFLTKGANK